MPAKDFYHNTVVNALIKDGWIITDDPLYLRLTKGKKLFIDLGAQQLIAAEKGLEKIAVEIKSFRQASEMKDLEEALGQFVLYNYVLSRYQPDRKLYLAVTKEIGERVFEEEAGQILIEENVIKLFTFDPIKEEIVKWIS